MSLDEKTCITPNIDSTDNLYLGLTPYLFYRKYIYLMRDDISDETSKKIAQIFKEAPGEYINYSLNESFLNKAIQINDQLLIDALLNHSNIDINKLSAASCLTNLSALHTAASEIGKTAIITSLLQHPDININAQNIDSETALHIACENANLEAIKLLLDRSEINTNLSTYMGKLPGEYFTKSITDTQKEEVIKLLNCQEYSQYPGCLEEANYNFNNTFSDPFSGIEDIQITGGDLSDGPTNSCNIM